MFVGVSIVPMEVKQTVYSSVINNRLDTSDNRHCMQASVEIAACTSIGKNIRRSNSNYYYQSFSKLCDDDDDDDDDVRAEKP
jgi:hypothetical protein